jgi:hypothetical protein
VGLEFPELASQVLIGDQLLARVDDHRLLAR